MKNIRNIRLTTEDQKTQESLKKLQKLGFCIIPTATKDHYTITAPKDWTLSHSDSGWNKGFMITLRDHLSRERGTLYYFSQYYTHQQTKELFKKDVVPIQRLSLEQKHIFQYSGKGSLNIL